MSLKELLGGELKGFRMLQGENVVWIQITVHQYSAVPALKVCQTAYQSEASNFCVDLDCSLQVSKNSV